MENYLPRVPASLSGLPLTKASVEDAVVKVYWADGQRVYKKTTDEYDAPTRWPVLRSPLVLPQQTRFLGARVVPPGPVTDPVVSANAYYYRLFSYAAEELSVQGSVYFPPSRSPVEEEYELDIGDVDVYASGIFIFTRFSGQVPGQPDFSLNRTIGDGLSPALTLDDLIDPQPFIEARILELIDTGVIDPGTLEIDPGLTSPEVVQYDINMDFVATEIGATIRSQLELDPTQYRLRPKTYFNSGDKNLKFLNQVSPRVEDTTEDFGFVGTDVLNVFVFYFNNFGENFESLAYPIATVNDDPFVAGLRDRFEQFKGHASDVWLEFGIAEEAEPIYVDPTLPGTLTDQTEVFLQDLCAELADLGFVYRGRVDYRDPDSVQQITDRIKSHWGLE